MTYDLAWRHLFDANHRASESVRKQLGDQLKSALSYTFRRATLDDPNYPLHGWAFRCMPEPCAPDMPLKPCDCLGELPCTVKEPKLAGAGCSLQCLYVASRGSPGRSAPCAVTSSP